MNKQWRLFIHFSQIEKRTHRDVRSTFDNEAMCETVKANGATLLIQVDLFFRQEVGNSAAGTKSRKPETSTDHLQNKLWEEGFCFMKSQMKKSKTSISLDLITQFPKMHWKMSPKTARHKTTVALQVHGQRSKLFKQPWGQREPLFPEMYERSLSPLMWSVRLLVMGRWPKIQNLFIEIQVQSATFPSWRILYENSNIYVHIVCIFWTDSYWNLRVFVFLRTKHDHWFEGVPVLQNPLQSKLSKARWFQVVVRHIRVCRNIKKRQTFKPLQEERWMCRMCVISRGSEEEETFGISSFAVPVFSDAWWSVLTVLNTLPGDGLDQEQ